MDQIETAYPDRSYRLLIVDDDATDRRNYARLLGSRTSGSLEIVQTETGAEGLAVLRDSRVDCVLLDFNLPDMNGLEFLAHATSEGELSCAVVLVTGHGNEAIAVEAMRRGVQDYLAKDQLNERSLWRVMTRSVKQAELCQSLANSLREQTALNAALEKEAAIRKAAEADLRAAKEAAEQANLAKTRFVAMVTHELRTPLNGILGYAQLLRLQGGLTTLQDTQVGAMMQAGKHLLEMIEQVLDFATIEAGRMELHPVPIPVRELGERCIAFIGPIAAEHALSLRMVSSHDAPKQIVADAARLRQLLLNLLGNAVKYTDVGGIELRFLAGGCPGGLRIEIADTGSGIKEEARGNLFQDFERLGVATSVEGAGLGLAIAARIIALMHGKIGHCPNPGGGSVFWLELPPIEASVAAPQQVVPAAPTMSAKRVLLVDDIAMNRDVIGAFLRAAGHSVLFADGGREGVRIAFEEQLDLILMDVRMPEMDGLEATRRIRAFSGSRGQVPILALTAYSFAEHVAQCRDAGMDGHVSKPVDYEALMRAITDTLVRTRIRWTHSAAATPPADRQGKEPTLPRLDRAVLEDTISFLPHNEIAANLGSLRAREEQMLSLLDQAAAPAQLTEAAHSLISAAGMFGFSALCAAARKFERAAANRTAEVQDLSRHLRAEIVAALAALDEFLLESRGQSAAVPAT